MADTQDKMLVDEMADTQENKEEKTRYKDCIGPDSKYIILVAKDKSEFKIEREHAKPSITIQDMLSGPGAQADEISTVLLPEYSPEIVDIVRRYLQYKHEYTNASGDIPDFHIPPEYALDVLGAAYYLGV